MVCFCHSPYGEEDLSHTSILYLIATDSPVIIVYESCYLTKQTERETLKTFLYLGASLFVCDSSGISFFDNIIVSRDCIVVSKSNLQVFYVLNLCLHVDFYELKPYFPLPSAYNDSIWNDVIQPDKLRQTLNRVIVPKYLS